MKILIVGGGKPLYFMCRAFMSKGYEVTVINGDEDECVRLARKLKVLVVHGDGSDSRVMEEAGVYGTDVVLAVTAHDQDNLVICQIAAVKFHVSKTIALVNDPDNEEVFRKLGVSAFSTTHIIARLIEERASLDEITNLIPVGEGKVNITEVGVLAEFPVAGKALREIELPDNSLVAIVLREGSAIVPRGSTRILTGDRVILVTLPENHGPVIKAFTGEG